MIRVGVIRGGISSEYDVSLSTGAHVLAHLRSEPLSNKYQVIDFLLDKNGVLHYRGLPISIEKLHDKVDIIFNALHGDFGEDGKLQQILDHWKIPYTGSGIFPSAMGYNKMLSKEMFKSIGIKTPDYVLLPVYKADIDGSKEDYILNKAREVWNKMPAPWIVKSLSGGSSIGIHMCKTYDDLVRAITDGVDHKVSILIEEMIIGKEATVGVIDKFRNQECYTLPPIEIQLPNDKKLFDYEAKYDPRTREICPGNFKREDKAELEKLAKLIHKEFGLNHYSRSDFILHPTKGIYALEVNTLPGLTDKSLIPLALESVGSSMTEFIDHVLQMALGKK